MTPKKITVRIKKWLRNVTVPNSSGYSTLRNDAGAMCCLGFMAQQCGVNLTKYDGSAVSPEDLFAEDKKLLPKGVLNRDGTDSKWAHEAMRLNDDDDENKDGTRGTKMTLAERQKALKDHFAKIGLKLNFVD
jgi:hypothetical protein